MRKNRILFACIMWISCIGLITGSLWAGEKEDDHFSGSFLVGYRMVDTDGAETKYMEDINLEKGPRLFHFKLHFAPQKELKKLFDTMEIRLYNFGGDPFQSLGIDVQKYGKYKFRFDRRKSTYYYNDMLEGHDFHTFNFDRVNDSGLLKVTLGKGFHAHVDFNRYTKKGKSVTTFDINRVEFEFDKPIDEESTEIALGIDYVGKKFSIALMEKIQDFENANSLFLPGYADGGDFARYPSSLSLFHINMPYDMEGNTHIAKFTAQPFKNLLVRGSMQLTKQDTNFLYYEDAMGVDYLGYDFMDTSAGDGEFERKIQSYDFDLSYIFSNKLAFIGAARYQNFEQTGSITADGETTNMDLKYETGGFEAGLQYQPTGSLGLTLGFRFEQRDVEDAVEIENVNGPTERTGFFGNLKWRLGKSFKMTADYQYGSYENPFTLVSPTDFHRFRLTVNYKNKNFYANGSYLYNLSKSDQNGAVWESQKNQFAMRLGFNNKKVKTFVGYKLLDISRDGDRTVYYPPAWIGGEGSFLWDIFFDGTSHLFDAYLKVMLDKSWGLGGYFNYYENKGSWELTRTTIKVFLRYTFSCGFMSHVGYRFVDFKEKEMGYNDYKANILEISFGYQW